MAGGRPVGPTSCSRGADCRLQNGWGFKVRLCPVSLLCPGVPLPWPSAEVGWNRLLLGVGPPQEGMFALGVEWDHSGLPTVGLAKRAPLPLSALLACQEPLDGLLMARTLPGCQWDQPVGVPCVRHRGPRAREAGWLCTHRSGAPLRVSPGGPRCWRRMSWGSFRRYPAGVLC